MVYNLAYVEVYPTGGRGPQAASEIGSEIDVCSLRGQQLSGQPFFQHRHTVGDRGGSDESRGRIQQISESQFPSFFLFFLTVTLWKMSERPTQAVYCIGCRELE